MKQKNLLQICLISFTPARFILFRCLTRFHLACCFCRILCLCRCMFPHCFFFGYCALWVHTNSVTDCYKPCAFSSFSRPFVSRFSSQRSFFTSLDGFFPAILIFIITYYYFRLDLCVYSGVCECVSVISFFFL